jgi:aryl-alcohol dehydrogenase-like predicted oxidoreductase
VQTLERISREFRAAGWERDDPRVSSVLFGATTPEHVAENVAAL